VNCINKILKTNSFSLYKLYSYLILDWIAKIIEDKDALLKKCEEIFSVISDKTDILDFLWNHVWEQVR